MSESNHAGPPVITLARKALSTGVGALHNRGELLVLELQEEKSRLIRLLIRGILAVFLTIMTLMLITGTIVMIVPDNYRLLTVGIFAALYLAGTIWAALSLKTMLKRAPFSETLAQFRRDGDVLKGLE